jgi:ABC-2 type transport system ATP-binding protein
VGTLVRAGFNVLSWDPRGFHQSGGTVEFNSPRYEGRDVSALISWLARQPQALLDGPGDPRVGMAGGSYGGAIQLVAAAEDRRLDALVPDVTYHSLLASFAPSDTPKTGWIGLFVASGWFAGRLDPLLLESYGTTVTGEPLTPAERAFFATRGPGHLVSRVRAPTLLLAGTVDSLFPPSEAVANYEALRRVRTPVRMLWFCGGHGLCPGGGGNRRRIDQATLAWFDRYLKRQAVDTGPRWEWIDQAGHAHAAADYPGPAGRPLAATGDGELPVGPGGGSGPAQPGPGDSAELRLIAALSPTPAQNAVGVRLPAPRAPAELVGAPTLTVGYQGLAEAGSVSDTRVYAQLVDGDEVLGDQVTPIPVRLDGRFHSLTLPLQAIAALARPGASLTLQLTASCAGFQVQPAIGAIRFSTIRVSVPTVRSG